MRPKETSQLFTFPSSWQLLSAMSKLNDLHCENVKQSPCSAFTKDLFLVPCWTQKKKQEGKEIKKKIAKAGFMPT